MTAQELINILSKFLPETKVGRIGHFGEFYELDEYSVHADHIGYSIAGERVIDIDPPDIGLEPD